MMHRRILGRHAEREHQRMYRLFEDWVQGHIDDLEMSASYAFKPRDFLTSPVQDWDALLDRGADGTGDINESF